MIEYLYVIRETGTNLCKIGRSTDVMNRLKSLQTGNPRKLYIDRVVDGSKISEVESLIHSLLISFQLEGEWFDIDNNQITSSSINNYTFKITDDVINSYVQTIMKTLRKHGFLSRARLYTFLPKQLSSDDLQSILNDMVSEEILILKETQRTSKYNVNEGLA